MYEEFTQDRIAQLRIQRKVSARDMSLSLGQLNQPDRKQESIALTAGTVIYLRVFRHHTASVF